MTVLVDVRVELARLFLIAALRARERREEAVDLHLIVAVREQKVLDVFELFRRLAAREPRQLDDARSVKLLDLVAVERDLHRQQSVVAVVESDAHSFVECESVVARLRVVGLNLDRCLQDAHRAARRIERAVAEELLELEAVALGDFAELALEVEHLFVRRLLFLFACARELAERLRERRDVVDEAEAIDDRLDDAAAAAGYWAEGAPGGDRAG